MNQRVHNLSKWRFLKEGDSLHFPKNKPRIVILEVNCPGEVCFYVDQDAEAIRRNERRLEDEAAGREVLPIEPLSFLGVAKGRERFEFAVDGPFSLLVEGGSAYIYTADGQDVATRVVAPVIYTRIANRRQRNPHLELIEYQMKLNTERMVRQLEAESARRIEALEHKLERYLPNRDQKATPDDFARAARRDRVAEGEHDVSAPGVDNGESSGEDAQGSLDVDRGKQKKGSGSKSGAVENNRRVERGD